MCIMHAFVTIFCASYKKSCLLSLVYLVMISLPSIVYLVFNYFCASLFFTFLLFSFSLSGMNNSVRDWIIKGMCATNIFYHIFYSIIPQPFVELYVSISCKERRAKKAMWNRRSSIIFIRSTQFYKGFVRIRMCKLMMKRNVDRRSNMNARMF